MRGFEPLLVTSFAKAVAYFDRPVRACDNKFPKLFAWKQKHGAQTILVLEENDVQLTNHEVVYEAYLPIALTRDDRPDETYLISTSIEPWNAWPLLIGNKTLDDLRVDGYAPRWDIDPSRLPNATIRSAK